MNTYLLDELMAQTRRLAVEYREKTGQVLPVGHELARYDVARLFGFSQPRSAETSVDFIGQGDWLGHRIQVKSRVLFDHRRSHQRIGQLNMEADWDTVFLLLFDAQYEPRDIYALDKNTIKVHISPEQKQSSKGPMSVAKFKSLARLIWTANEALEPIWENHPLSP